MNLSRLESLVGEENIKKIKNLKVLILGLGGVGGYAVESLTRCGVSNITLVDGDTIKPSNINRQIIATRWNNNRYKTKEWKKRIKKINPSDKLYKECEPSNIIKDLNLLNICYYDKAKYGHFTQ